MSEIKDMFRTHFEQGSRYMARRKYPKTSAADFEELVKAGCHEREGGRRDYRDGYHQRSSLTSEALLI